MPVGPFNDVKITFTNVPGFIAHYYTQSENEFNRRKGRIMDDGTCNKNKINQSVHDIHNECLNTLLREKYSNKIKEFIKF
jgi:hypothetical protein